MIIVHHLNNSRSQRILWLLEELGVEYEIKHYQRDPDTSRAPAELKAVHPLGKSPVIEDDGLIVAETGAIIVYLLDKFADDRLRPEKGTQAYVDYVHFLHFAVFPLEAAKARGRLNGYEACNDYVEKIHKRPAYLKALEKGGDYAYGPK